MIPRTRDDEDKGSPSQDGVNPGETSRGKIDRSAEALRVRHHPFHLSLRKWNFAMQRRASNAADRNAKSGNMQGQFPSCQHI